MRLVANNGAVIAEVVQYGTNPKVAYGDGVSVMLSNAALKRLADVGECDIKTDIIPADDIPEVEEKKPSDDGFGWW